MRPIFGGITDVGSRWMAPMEAAVVNRRAGRMSGAEFRAFQDKRPDHERWELLGGVPMMMTPPTLSHNQIATNLQTLLNDALERQDPSMLAAQRPGLELASGVLCRHVKSESMTL
jgi:Uma2 family endonuclease